MTKQNVVVYVSEDCSQCDKVLSHLENWEVEYTEKNISQNKQFIQELQHQKVYGTPAVFVDDLKILGFQKNKLKQALGIDTGSTFYKGSKLHFKRQ
ncbi:glutaredoxin family protein [Sediminibacillus albus]|uniref:Glutaredoxin n=1 Tax=Sediminibacillus albus TaxID=407036 RepID=A0A1G9AVB1_9BACI|nr:glutaredoxin family protein [Sediminibacillus albus]SDK30834.1 Glutaredoxin [Sediminibacillus albus]